MVRPVLCCDVAPVCRDASEWNWIMAEYETQQHTEEDFTNWIWRLRGMSDGIEMRMVSERVYS